MARFFFLDKLDLDGLRSYLFLFRLIQVLDFDCLLVLLYFVNELIRKRKELGQEVVFIKVFQIVNALQGLIILFRSHLDVL